MVIRKTFVDIIRFSFFALISSSVFCVCSVNRYGYSGKRLVHRHVDVAKARDERAPPPVGRLVVQVVLERQPLEREPERAEPGQRGGHGHRVHVVLVQRHGQVKLAQPVAAGQHVAHAGRGRFVAHGQVQTEPAQPSQLAHALKHVVRHVRALPQAQRLQSAGSFQTCKHTKRTHVYYARSNSTVWASLD